MVRKIDFCQVRIVSINSIRIFFISFQVMKVAMFDYITEDGCWIEYQILFSQPVIQRKHFFIIKRFKIPIDVSKIVSIAYRNMFAIQTADMIVMIILSTVIQPLPCIDGSNEIWKTYYLRFLLLIYGINFINNLWYKRAKI